MKTYIMSIPDTIIGIGEKLNITSLLCNKSWIVFNEEGVKTLYIFDKDGSLIISNNGLASNSHWKYIKANKTILIEDDGISFLLHPTFINEAIFILQQDGTQQYLFLIDEKKGEQLLLNSLSAINNYVKDLAPQPYSNNDRKIIQIEEQRKQREKIAEEFQDEIKQATLPIKKRRNIFIVSGILCFVIFIILGNFISHSENYDMTSWFMLLTGICGFLMLIGMAYEDSIIDDKRNEIIDRELNRQSKV